MAPNDYYPGNYSYQAPPNSSQPYSDYQTSNAGRSTGRSYQSTNIPTSQSDYTTYPTQVHNNQRQEAYAGQTQQQDGSWSNNRAAETLRNLSNAAYTTSSNSAGSGSGFTPANATTSNRYSTSALQPTQTQYASKLSGSHSQASYGHAQARPRSVNSTAAVASTARSSPIQSNGLPSPAVAAGYPLQRVQQSVNQQRSASPAYSYQPNHSSTHASYKKQSSSTTSASNSDFSHPVLQNAAEAPRSSLSGSNAVSVSFDYSDRQTTASAAQTTTTFYEQHAITVDPTQVYDPWPEYQRKQEALRAQKAAEDAALAEEKRKEEEIKRVEEARRNAEEERKKAEDQKRLEGQQRIEEQRRALEQQRRALEPQVLVPVPAAPPVEKKPRKPRGPKKATASTASAANASKSAPSTSSVADTEAEIRALMAKMRELNNKDPALLAKIWEQERKTHIANTTFQTSAALSPNVLPGQTPREPGQKAFSRAPKAASQQAPAVNGASNVPAPPPPANILHAHAVTQPPQTQRSQIPAQLQRGVRQGGTIWPPDKKVQLAATASEWLNQFSENKNKLTTGDQILRMLDSNPSYIELCEKLETLGLRLERAQFAKALLAAVPDVNSAARQATPAVQPPPLANAQPNGGMVDGVSNIPRKADTPVQSIQNANAPNGVSQSPPNHMENASPASMYPSPQTEPSSKPYHNAYPPFPDVDSPPPMLEPDSPTPFSAPMAQMVSKGNIDSQTLLPPPKPANKEEAARKRDFSEFVDLTVLSDEDDLTPVKKSKIDQGNFPRQSFAGSIPANAPSPNVGRFPILPSQPAHDDPHRSITPPIKDPKYSNIVQPLNRKKALRRSAYDIRTIARDVLLATGRHPDMRPLNAHLDILKSSFAEVDNSVDLSTLRWDIIDPGKPPEGYLQNSLLTQEQGDADDEDDSEDEQARARVRPHIAIQQTIGAGGSGERNSFSVTPSFNGIVKTRPKRRGRPARASYSMTSRPSGFGDREVSNPRTKLPPVKKAADSEQAATSKPTGSSENHGNSGSSAPVAASSPTATTSAFRTSGTGYVALRPVNEDGTPIKKKGRPVGWRKAIHGSAEAQARAVTRQPSGLRNVRTAGAGIDSSPAKGTKLTGNVRTEANYQIYKCKWQLCTAELHSLETLRKHVQKIHGKAAAHGGFDCLWESCGKDIVVHDKRTGESEQRHQYYDFDELAKWREHLELKHFGPLAWTMGDGPPSGQSDAHDSEAYMSDRHGRRVTPRISVPSSLVDNTGKGRATASAIPEAPRRGRPPKAPQEKIAQEAEDQMLKKKREVGPGVDRGGARLVTPKRRRGFDDNEDFDEMIVNKED